jgi:hypothetical protein
MKLLKYGGIFFSLMFLNLVHLCNKQRIIRDKWSVSIRKSILTKKGERAKMITEK